ncbi:MAG: hypothetical protein ABIN89_25835 [Chitinophagaceae bacterium]
MPANQLFYIEIDKLTRSIENAISGDNFKTEILELTILDIRRIKKVEWVFDWKREAKNKGRTVFKLIIVDNPKIIQGLISVQDKGDHIYMHLIESSRFNRGNRKVYLGVPGNLVAFACQHSFNNGYAGFVSFESKTKLIDHYRNTLGAHVLFGNIMALDTKAATKLVKQYFPEKP